MAKTDDIRKPATESTIPSTQAASMFADLVTRAHFRDERIVVTVYGKERAAIVGMDDLERLRALDRDAAA